ncbi:hypothetical protein TNCV_3566661 [Trichonephila clavipes]|nr:hypothetical protein TNCV_3566661 [Trichonephila clavipes]
MDNLGRSTAPSGKMMIQYISPKKRRRDAAVFQNASCSSSCASASSSNARELDEQILEVKINPQGKNIVSDTSTNKDTLSKEKESENENEETELIRNDFAHYADTPIDADLREQILKLGPYQPEGNFQKDAKVRSFSSSYGFISKAGQKIERKWLCYSTKNGVSPRSLKKRDIEKRILEIKLINSFPPKIIWRYGIYPKLFDKMSDIEFHEGMSFDVEDITNAFVIIDDLMNEVGDDKRTFKLVHQRKPS